MESELPSAVACFQDDFGACIAHLRMPVKHRKAIRTTNLLEKLAAAGQVCWPLQVDLDDGVPREWRYP